MSALLDPVIVAQLGNLHLRARRILDGLFSGRHTNRSRGSSQEFSQHRAYNPGDDLKYLDWKILGRTDRLVVKQYEEETNVMGTVVVDDSGSMGYASAGRLTKLEYARTLAAAFGYLLVHQQDAIGLLSSRQILPASAQRGQLDEYFESLEQVKPQGVWDFRGLLESIPIPFKRKGFIIILSDLLGETEQLMADIRALAARKNEVLVFHILDPLERDLNLTGPVLFEDMETGETILTEPEVIRDRYQQIITDRIKAFAHAFRRARIDYQVLTTDTPFDKGLGPFLSWRGIAL